nr:hypothetical protein [bacterium]
MNKLYLTAKDLQQMIPNLTYDNAIKYINEARKIMKERNYLIPVARPKVALTEIVLEMLGIKK